jgi:hypothetical protein
MPSGELASGTAGSSRVAGDNLGRVEKTDHTKAIISEDAVGQDHGSYQRGVI